MKNFIKYFIILLSCVTCFMLHVTWTNAQQVALSISPPILTAYMKPGKSILIAYNIENRGDPTILSTKVVSFEPRDLNGNINIKNSLEGPIRFSLDNANLQLGSQFFLKTSDKQQILLRIRVPDGAPEGDYYYTILAETEPPPTLEGVSSSKSKASIGSNIIITVTNTGLISVNAKVSLFDIYARHTLNIFGNKYKIIDSFDPVPVILIVNNIGKNFVTAEGEIVMRGNFGERAKYNLVPLNILSETQRMLKTNTSRAPNCDSFKNLPIYCKQPISHFISGFFLGTYNLSTSLTFGENSPTIFASTSFIALPIKISFGIMIVTLIAIIVIIRFREKE